MTDPRTVVDLVGGGELGRCLTRLHHDRFTAADTVVDPVAADRIAAGRRWEAEVLAILLDGVDAAALRDAEQVPDAVAILLPEDLSRSRRERLTLVALAAGARLVLGGRLVSPDRNAVGEPDLLVRLDGGYAPVEVKWHRVLDEDGLPARLSHLPDLWRCDGTGCFLPARSRDLVQIAHYRRLLEDHGVASDAPVGGVIGTDPGPRCAWVDLTRGDPSPLARADTALAEAVRTLAHGRTHPEHPLVPPLWRRECRDCPWRGPCRHHLETRDDVSLLPHVTPRIAARLVAAGIDTTTRLADLRPGTRLGGTRIPHEAVLEARARQAGTLLPRRRAVPDFASVTTEVDLDLETYHGTIYLAGLLTTSDAGTTYRPIADWTGTPAGEREVVRELFAAFDELAGGDAVVYHWTGYERRMLRGAAARHGLRLRSAPDVDAWFDRFACDLWRWTKEHFVSPDGYSLKVVAPLCGFRWRDADPGGAQSELWYAAALAGAADQRERILAYNEDDVVAQLAIRRWVRARRDGEGRDQTGRAEVPEGTGRG